MLNLCPSNVFPALQLHFIFFRSTFRYNNSYVENCEIWLWNKAPVYLLISARHDRLLNLLICRNKYGFWLLFAHMLKPAHSKVKVAPLSSVYFVTTFDDILVFASSAVNA